MKKIIKKLGVYNSIAVLVMIIGVVLYLLTPVFLRINSNWDTDIIGLMVFVLGVALLVAGIVVRALGKKR